MRPGACQPRRPSVLLPESWPLVRGFPFGAARRSGAWGLSRMLACVPKTDATRERYGVPERFRANCAFGGHELLALSHSVQRQQRMSLTESGPALQLKKRGCRPAATFRPGARIRPASYGPASRARANTGNPRCRGQRRLFSAARAPCRKQRRRPRPTGNCIHPANP